MPDTYTHPHTPAPCEACHELSSAWLRGDLPKAALEDMWRHFQTCAILAAQVKAGKAQIAAKRESGEFVGMAHPWMVAEAIPA